MQRRQNFKQSDVTRAIKGAKGAGVDVISCQLRPDGTIYIQLAGGGGDAGPNDFDEVLRP